MTSVGQLDRRVTFRQEGTDPTTGESTGWADVATRYARIQGLVGSESVQASRMAGRQPVIITVHRDSVTRTIDNGWQVVDARDPTLKWDVTSKIETEDLAWVEILAVQLKGGDVE